MAKSESKVPSISARRDDGVGRGSRPAERRIPSGGGGLSRMLLAATLAVAVAVGIQNCQIQRQLDATSADSGTRIEDLEDRLSDTDQGMLQTSEQMAQRIQELSAEVDKLWASAWRRNKASIDAIEEQLKSQAEVVERMRTATADLERLAAAAKKRQVLVERLGDDVSRMNLSLARMQKEVEGMRSDFEAERAAVDGFRKATNQKLLKIETGG